MLCGCVESLSMKQPSGGRSEEDGGSLDPGGRFSRMHWLMAWFHDPHSCRSGMCWKGHDKGKQTSRKRTKSEVTAEFLEMPLQLLGLLSF